MSAILADSTPIAGPKLPCFPSCERLMLSASPTAPPRLWPTWAVTAQSMLNDGANHPNHPKYGWKVENMCQTTNQSTIAAFFRPTRIDRKKNTPAILRVVSHLKKRDKTVRPSDLFPYIWHWIEQPNKSIFVASTQAPP